eukprot:1384697-Pyramimonas_sp.AAC.1
MAHVRRRRAQQRDDISLVRPNVMRPNEIPSDSLQGEHDRSHGPSDSRPVRGRRERSRGLLPRTAHVGIFSAAVPHPTAASMHERNGGIKKGA